MAKLTIQELHRTEAYRALTQKQQRLVELFLETGDKVKSILSVFRCKSEETARTMTYDYFGKPRVLECIAVANGEDPERATFDAELERAIHNRKINPQQVKALQLFAKVHGYGVAEIESADEPQKFAIGSVIMQDGQKYRVVAQEIE